METEIERQVRSCPLNGKKCVDGIRDDFEVHPVTGQKIKCRFWIHVAGKDPQSDVRIDHFDCSIAWLPMLIIENSKEVRQTSASVDEVRKAVITVKEQPVFISMDPKPELIEHNGNGT